MILWRPVGMREMALVFEAGMRAFPPRLPEQPIFYPVLVEAYADQIASTWNTAEEPFAGYVLEMEIPDGFAARYAAQTVGAAMHRELWVPAEDLAEFNRQMTRPIAVRRAFFGPRFRGHVPERYGLRGAEADRQIAMMMATMDDSTFDLAMEVAANRLAIFLNFPYWKAAGAERLAVAADRLERCLETIRAAWALGEPPSALIEEASCVGLSGPW